MRTSLDLCVCLLTLCGITLGLTGPGVKVVVEEDSDAVLPCSLSTKEDMTRKIFDWKKDGQKEVFFYDSGIFTSQDQQFIGRVSHFQDQLMNGNASIKIHNTKMADSGTYSCIFPHLQPRQTFNIELVVGRLLRDRSGEIPGASPKPHITTLQTKDGLLLQCEVRGASPKPKVEWQDSAGNILPAEEPQVSERRGRYYVTLKTTVTKTDRYRCVATQEDISHQIHAETFVPFREDLSREVDLWRSTTIILAVLVAVLLLVVALIRRRYLSRRSRHVVREVSGYGLGEKPSDDDLKKPYDPFKLHDPDELEIVMSDDPDELEIVMSDDPDELEIVMSGFPESGDPSHQKTPGSWALF